MRSLHPQDGTANSGSNNPNNNNNNPPGGGDPPPPAPGKEIFVGPGGTGDGTTEAAPLGSVQSAMNQAQAGETVTILPGTYTEDLSTSRNGENEKSILVKAKNGRGSVIIRSTSGRALQVNHAYWTFWGLVFDGRYGNRDLILVRKGGDNLTFKNVEVKESSRDCMDIEEVNDILIEDSLIHHCLNYTGGQRVDAHGIVGVAVRNLTIKNTAIHTFSGDAVQLDPNRSALGWDNLVISGCHFWLKPLPALTNGFPAGSVPGENAFDSKVGPGRPKILIEKTIASGFKDGLISNMAAFNLKESIEVTVDRVLVFDSDIAFRVRGPAHTTIMNSVVHSTARAVRYEDDVQILKIWNSTFGGDITTFLQAASSVSTGVEIKNSVYLTQTLPTIAGGDSSNVALPAAGFANTVEHDYHLKSGSLAQGKGVLLPLVVHDYDGKSRSAGGPYDSGAFLAP